MTSSLKELAKRQTDFLDKITQENREKRQLLIEKADKENLSGIRLIRIIEAEIKRLKTLIHSTTPVTEPNFIALLELIDNREAATSTKLSLRKKILKFLNKIEPKIDISPEFQKKIIKLIALKNKITHIENKHKWNEFVSDQELDDLVSCFNRNKAPETELEDLNRIINILLNHLDIYHNNCKQGKEKVTAPLVRCAQNIRTTHHKKLLLLYEQLTGEPPKEELIIRTGFLSQKPSGLLHRLNNNK